MKVALVCYENPSSWILGKLALRLSDELTQIGVDAEVCTQIRLDADINHHVIYTGIKGAPPARSTAMITHVDTASKVDLLRSQLASIEMGICLSRDTVQKLVALGLPETRLCAINFPSPQSGRIEARRIQIAITSRVYEHGSKREYMLGELARHLPPNLFAFHIMGAGWEPVVHELRSRGIEVRYYPRFNEGRYRQLWKRIDYYLYLGQDEGSTGLLDALEAGVQTIATPQGFHLDLEGGITHAVTDFADLARVFNQLARDKLRLQAAGATWNWRRYAQEHLEVWTRLLDGREEAESDGLARTPKWILPAMPMAAGPGGAIHRPRLLLITNGDVQSVVSVWSTLKPSIPDMHGVIIKGVGEEVDLEVLRTAPHLEVRVADIASWSPADLSILSLDFDCVAFWNCLSIPHMKSLVARRKPNYLMRSRALGRLASLIVAIRPLQRLAGPGFFRWIRQLQDESRAKVVSFVVSQNGLAPLRQGVSDENWNLWWSSVALLVHSDEVLPDDLPPLGPETAISSVPANTLVENTTPDPAWRAAFIKLFETMAIPHSAAKPSSALITLKKAQHVVHRRGR